MRSIAAATALSVALVACGGNGDDADDAAPAAETATQTEDPSEGLTEDTGSATGAEGGPDTPASELRATLTAGLQEHVYLAGIAVYTGVQAGGDLEDPTFQAAAGALDQNSQDLAAAIGSVYGQEAGDAFLPLWRKHIDFFVDYTLAKATGDDAAAQQARDGLDQYRTDFGAFLAGANPNLPADAVAMELVPHVDTVFDTIDAVVAGDGTAFDKLKTAAGVIPGTAAILAGGIATQFPDEISGDPASAGADLRSTLTAGLQEHVYLAGIAVYTGVQAGGDLEDPTFQAAAGALDQNSQDLAAAIGSVYGQEAGDAFLPLWRKHIDFFVDYTLAKATGDDAAAQQARDGLDQYRTDFGAFLAGANPNLPADAVAMELVPHVDTVFDTIDAVVAGDGTAFDKLKTAAGVIPGTAAILAGGIATQFPDEISGDPASAGADLRSTLTAGLQEHVYLAGIAVYTGVQAGGDLEDPTFQAAAGALDQNS
ncbi:MAG: hypothetical protein KY469_19430, partial [Actinobacteria bacterium]|nr:hypothetical protein [Actinomycetota bacterium]